MPEFDINNEATVLVLGAGASQPYGFPLSPGLKNLILNATQPTLMSCLTEKGHGPEIIKRFNEALQYGDYGTIDLFLEQKTSFREVGSYFIANVIARAENHDGLFRSRNWYTHLYRILGLDSAGDGMPPVEIVTLNYDRSLEHFLAQYLEYNCPDRVIESSRRKRQRIRIVHAHGSIGAYDAVPYGEAAKNQSFLHAAAQSIRIVSDSMDSAPDFAAAENLLGHAKNIFFIGFGYNRTTLERLLKRVNISSVRFFGTAFQLPDETESELRQVLGDRIRLGEKNVETVGFLQWIGLTK
jgi:hypothetical protein